MADKILKKLCCNGNITGRANDTELVEKWISVFGSENTLVKNIIVKCFIDVYPEGQSKIFNTLINNCEMDESNLNKCLRHVCDHYSSGFDIVKLLCQKGANDWYGGLEGTLEHCNLKKGPDNKLLISDEICNNIEVAQFMIENGNIDFTRWNNYTERRRGSMISDVININKESLLHCKCRLNDIEEVRRIIRSGGIDKRDLDNCLLTAYTNCDMDLVKLLYLNGAVFHNKEDSNDYEDYLERSKIFDEWMSNYKP